MTVTWMRRVAVAVGLGIAGLTSSATGAGAFEPPADPTNNFTCEGGAVPGHPGAKGLQVAMGKASSSTAWNAVANADPIELCG